MFYFKYTPYYIWDAGECRQWCALLGPFGSFRSFNIILPSQSRPYQRTSTADTPFSLRWRKILGYSFIWTIIDHSAKYPIGCSKKTVNAQYCLWYFSTRIISTFLTYGLFVIIYVYDSCLHIKYAALTRPGRLVHVSLFFWFSLKKVRSIQNHWFSDL